MCAHLAFAEMRKAYRRSAHGHVGWTNSGYQVNLDTHQQVQVLHRHRTCTAQYRGLYCAYQQHTWGYTLPSSISSGGMCVTVPLYFWLIWVRLVSGSTWLRPKSDTCSREDNEWQPCRTRLKILAEAAPESPPAAFNVLCKLHFTSCGAQPYKLGACRVRPSPELENTSLLE
jgi:hypothetical protein